MESLPLHVYRSILRVNGVAITCSGERPRELVSTKHSSLACCLTDLMLVDELFSIRPTALRSGGSDRRLLLEVDIKVSTRYQ